MEKGDERGRAGEYKRNRKRAKRQEERRQEGRRRDEREAREMEDEQRERIRGRSVEGVGGVAVEEKKEKRTSRGEA